MQKQIDNKMFIQYSMRTTKLKVYRLEEDVVEEDRKRFENYKFFSFSPGCFFFGTPRNEFGSLLQNPGIRTFTDYMKISKQDVEDDNIGNLLPEIGDFAVEELLTAEELEKIREKFDYEYVEDMHNAFMLSVDHWK